MLLLNGHFAQVTGLLAASLFLAPGSEEDGGGYYDAAEANFNFGDSCEKLADLSWESLMQLTIAADDRAKARFCTVAVPTDCDGLTAAIEEFGELRAARKAGYCRFVPWPRPREVMPPVFRNFG